MIRRAEGRRRAALGAACVVVVWGWCTACGLLPLWQTAPVPPVVVAPGPTKQAVQVSAAPAFRLIVPTNYGPSPARLFVVNALVKNIGDAPLDFRPEGARLLLPDGSTGTVFDLPRAREILQRTRLASLSTPAGIVASEMSNYERSRLTSQVLGLLLYDTTLDPGDEAHGYLVADTGTNISTFEGLALEVAATRASDQSVVRDSYRFVPAAATTGKGGS